MTGAAQIAILKHSPPIIERRQPLRLRQFVVFVIFVGEIIRDTGEGVYAVHVFAQSLRHKYRAHGKVLVMRTSQPLAIGVGFGHSTSRRGVQIPSLCLYAHKWLRFTMAKNSK